MKRIGLIGCGIVGHALGVRLQRAGFEIRVHDRHRDKAEPLLASGAVWASSAAALSAGCEVLITALPRAENALEALTGPDGAWRSAARGTLHIDTSTIGVSAARTLAAEACSRGIRYVDAPLSAAGVCDGKPAIAMFVGSNADHYDLAKPVLAVLADRVHFLGAPPGLGQAVKLVNNFVSLSMTVVLADALAMGVKAGVPVELLRAALHDGTAQCRLLDEMLPASAFRGDWRPGLTLDLALKDLALAAELSSETHVDVHLMAATRAIYERAIANGWGALGSHAVLRLQEDDAGVSFRSSIFEQLPDPPIT